MDVRSISDFRKAYRNGPYAWPGGYPVYWLMSDGESVSFKVAKTERRNMLEALRDNDSSGWRPVALDVNWEDPELYCAHTNERIESAYAENDAAERAAESEHVSRLEMGDHYPA